MIENLLQFTVNGLLYGSVLALSAVGFSLIFGVLDIIDLSHGVQVVLGAYISFYLWQMGLDPVVTIPVVVAALFGIGYVYQRYLISPVVGTEALRTLLLTFGVALVARDLMNLGFSTNYRSISPSYAGESFRVDFLLIPLPQLLAFVLAIVFVGVLWVLLYRTETGRVIRAVAEDRSAARLIGIDVSHIFAITFAIGAAFSGAAGTLVGITSTFSPLSELIFTLYAFIVIIIGGVGRPLAALVGGFAVGLIRAYTILFVGSTYVNLVLFTLMVVILLVRPQGVLSRLGGST